MHICSTVFNWFNCLLFNSFAMSDTFLTVTYNTVRPPLMSLCLIMCAYRHITTDDSQPNQKKAKLLNADILRPINHDGYTVL